MNKLYLKQPIYPIIGILMSIIIIIVGLISAKKVECIYFLALIWLLLISFGYYKVCFKVLPIALFLSSFFYCLTYIITKNSFASIAAFNRIFVICTALIFGMGLNPIFLTRNLSQLKVPRIITLGILITLSFMPLLKFEIKRINEAMKTRGAGSKLNAKVFVRAFLIPLIIRIVNISDTLALSIETRGFKTDGKDYTVYKVIDLKARDIIFTLLIIALSFCLVII